uniref:Uncharacterized protein n=1 Tax=Cannabis sativa TaxID=3483 RepID=A0A803Q753_CANSA
MVNTRRTLAATFASLGLPEDPMTTDPDVCVPNETRISTNTKDVATSAISTDTTNLATIAGQVDTFISVDLNNRPIPQREDSPLTPPTEGRTHVEQPLGTTIEPRVWYYAGLTGLGIGEPHVELGENLELARLRETVCQVGQTEKPHAIDCNVFAQQRRQFLRWMDDHEYILRSH